MGQGSLNLPWPPYSPDLTPCDFFLWEWIKSRVYRSPVEDLNELIRRIERAFEELRSSLNFFIKYVPELIPQPDLKHLEQMAISNSLCLQLCYSVASTLLTCLITQTSINGVLNRGGMFIFSRNHFRNFVGLPDDWSPMGKKVLDMGAGDGGVTSVFSEFFMHVFVTDASKVMQWRLAQRGFTVLPIDRWSNSGHFHPQQLLAELHQVASESNCLVLISLVLPYSPFVEFSQDKKGGKEEKSDRPLSNLSVSGVKFETIWTKLPYCVREIVLGILQAGTMLSSFEPVAKLSTASTFPSSSYSEGIQYQQHRPSTSRDGYTTSTIISIHDET
uniref:Methyltransferase-like protein 9 n=1 Tax=Ditylenchus dipsaci TaxID=166011 RepID=A0A915D2H9_9BILA